MRRRERRQLPITARTTKANRCLTDQLMNREGCFGPQSQRVPSWLTVLLPEPWPSPWWSPAVHLMARGKRAGKRPGPCSPCRGQEVLPPGLAP